MSLQLKDEGAVPREGWMFFLEQTGFTIKAPNWQALYPEVVKHCQVNGAPVPALQEVIDWCCANLKIACVEVETHQPLINKFTLGLPAPAAQGCCGSK